MSRAKGGTGSIGPLLKLQEGSRERGKALSRFCKELCDGGNDACGPLKAAGEGSETGASDQRQGQLCPRVLASSAHRAHDYQSSVLGHGCVALGRLGKPFWALSTPTAQGRRRGARNSPACRLGGLALRRVKSTGPGDESSTVARILDAIVDFTAWAAAFQPGAPRARAASVRSVVGRRGHARPRAAVPTHMSRRPRTI